MIGINPLSHESQDGDSSIDLEILVKGLMTQLFEAHH